MLRPAHLMIQRRRQFSPGQIAAISGAVMLEVAVIYCVATSLKFGVGHVPPGPIQTKVLETPPPKVHPLVLPEPPLVRPPTVPVPEPEIPIQTPLPTPITADGLPTHPLAPAMGGTDVAPPKLRGVTAPVSIGGAHICMRQYPAIAVRLNQEGTTTVRFTVNTDGSVSNVQVVSSSGHDALDQAAIRCASSWRYKPALDGGQAVAAPWTTNVSWKLH